MGQLGLGGLWELGMMDGRGRPSIYLSLSAYVKRVWKMMNCIFAKFLPYGLTLRCGSCASPKNSRKQENNGQRQMTTPPCPFGVSDWGITPRPGGSKTGLFPRNTTQTRARALCKSSEPQSRATIAY